MSPVLVTSSWQIVNGLLTTSYNVLSLTDLLHAVFVFELQACHQVVINSFVIITKIQALGKLIATFTSLSASMARNEIPCLDVLAHLFFNVINFENLTMVF